MKRSLREIAKSLAMRSVRISLRDKTVDGYKYWRVLYADLDSDQITMPVIAYQTEEIALSEAEKIIQPEVNAILAAFDEVLSSGMPASDTSEDRLDEIRMWIKKADEINERDGVHDRTSTNWTILFLPDWEDEDGLWTEKDTVNTSRAIRDLMAHIDVLEARLRDMAQDDIGQAWGGGYKAGFTVGATAQKQADLAAIELARSTLLNISGETYYETEAVESEPIVQPK